MEVWFEDAREMLEATRQAALEIERANRQIELMCHREGPHGGGAGGGVRGGRQDVNGTGATVARMDYEESMRDRLERDYRLLDETYRVVYGQDGDGLDALAGRAPADVIWWRYGFAAPWSQVAAALGYSERQCRRMADVAIDILDGYGQRAAAAGVGIAEG